MHVTGEGFLVFVFVDIVVRIELVDSKMLRFSFSRQIMVSPLLVHGMSQVACKIIGQLLLIYLNWRRPWLSFVREIIVRKGFFVVINIIFVVFWNLLNGTRQVTARVLSEVRF
jgi:hypothetical protein